MTKKKTPDHDYTAYAGMGHNSAAALKNEIVELAQAQLAAERKVEKCEAELKKAEEELRVISEEQLPEKMDELGIPKFTTPDGIEIKTEDVINANISEERRDKANQWLDEKGYGNLLKTEVTSSFGREEIKIAKALEAELKKRGLTTAFKRSVHHQTLLAFIREHLAAGKDIPQDLFGIHRFRRSKVKIKKETF